MSDQPSSFETPAPTSAPEAAPVAPAPVVAAPPAFQVPDSAKDLIGEGKKYNSVDAALGALPHAQSHIDTLEQENARLRSDLDRAATLNDAVSRIEADNNQTAIPATPVVDQAQIREEARSVYEEISVEQRKADNVAVANQEMYKLYGDKLAEVTASVAGELGVSVEYMKFTAEQSPKAFLKLVSDNQAGSGGGMPQANQSTINSSAIDSQPNPNAPSAKVGKDGSTKGLLAGWRGAGAVVAENNK